jgi:hypothetical protein
MKTPEKSGNFGDKPPIPASGGYVINYARIKKPVGVYLRYVGCAVNKICKLLKGWGLVRIADKLDDFDSHILKILLRRFHPVNLYEKEGLSNTKKVVK